MKIVSLVPSATEIISSIGLKDNLIGISHECDFPLDILKLPRLTLSKISSKGNSKEINNNIDKLLKNSLSIYEVNIEILRKLQPDFIITQSQCNVCAISIEQVSICVEKVLSKKSKIIDLQAKNLKGILDDIYNCGQILNKLNEAKQIINHFISRTKDIKKKLSSKKRIKVLCVEWIEPLMLAGNWMPDLVHLACGINIGSNSGKHSPFTSAEQLHNLEFDVVIFLPCGYEIKKTYSELKKLQNLDKLFKGKSKYIVNGNKFFNRPGTSIFESLNILCEILHPEIFGTNPGYNRWIEFI